VSGVHALVLAAGSGSRFGGGKLLAPWRGGVLLDGALAAAFAAPTPTVTVVTGADAEAVARAATTFAAACGQAGRTRIVHAADHAEGMAASLRAGLAALPADAAGALVLLGDMPLIPHAVLAPLVAAVEGGAPAAAPVFDGRRGNPAALSRSLFAALLGLAGDKGARGVLDRLGDRLVQVASPDAGVLLDVDTRADVPQ